MPDQLEFIENQNVIQIKTFGYTSMEDMQGSLKTVSEIAERKNVCSVLVNAQELESLPRVSEIYQFVTSLPPKLKIAIVLPDLKRSTNVEDMSKVFEIQSTLDSFKDIGKDSEKNIRLFNANEEALDWLANNT